MYSYSVFPVIIIVSEFQGDKHQKLVEYVKELENKITHQKKAFQTLSEKFEELKKHPESIWIRFCNFTVKLCDIERGFEGILTLYL